MRSYPDVEVDEDEFAKLIRRMNPPRVVIDNDSCYDATVIRVDSVNKQGILLEVVRVLTDLNLIIRKAYISSDGSWFMDVFNVTDEAGNKVLDGEVISYIQKEYYIRHTDGLPISSESDRQRLIQCLKAAIERRASEGLELELQTEDRGGFLSEITRIFRENGLTIRRAEISISGNDTFYLSEMSGNPIDQKTIDLIKGQLGDTVLRVKQKLKVPPKPPEMVGSVNFIFGNLFKASFQSFR